VPPDSREKRFTAENAEIAKSFLPFLLCSEITANSAVNGYFCFAMIMSLIFAYVADGMIFFLVRSVFFA
jgi:hypothetical protein